MKRILLSVLVIEILFLSACGASAPAPAPTPAPSSTTTQTTKTHIYTDGRIEVRGSGEPIELINNPDATNPTFAEVVAFIERDRTDAYSYIFGPPKNAFVCSDFAETVHNNAEAAGIRASWVGIDIEGETEGHALNAFETTDLGLVYIDCTGKGLWDESPNRSSWDRRARVETGKPYAVAGMNSFASEFWFHTGAIPMRNSLKSAYPSVWELFKGHFTARLEWDKTHDIEALGQKWMQEWLQKHAVELSECGRMLEPRRSSDAWYVYMLDCWETPWFQPEQVIVKEEYIGGPNWRGFMEFTLLPQDAKVEQKIIEVDGLPIAWEIGWSDREGSWRKPFGNKVVKDIHIHWGE